MGFAACHNCSLMAAKGRREWVRGAWHLPGIQLSTLEAKAKVLRARQCIVASGRGKGVEGGGGQ